MPGNGSGLIKSIFYPATAAFPRVPDRRYFSLPVTIFSSSASKEARPAIAQLPSGHFHSSLGFVAATINGAPAVNHDCRRAVEAVRERTAA
jgi:hypothetical protein